MNDCSSHLKCTLETSVNACKLREWQWTKNARQRAIGQKWCGTSYNDCNQNVCVFYSESSVLSFLLHQSVSLPTHMYTCQGHVMMLLTGVSWRNTNSTEWNTKGLKCQTIAPWLMLHFTSMDNIMWKSRLDELELKHSKNNSLQLQEVPGVRAFINCIQTVVYSW